MKLGYFSQVINKTINELKNLDFIIFQYKTFVYLNGTYIILSFHIKNACLSEIVLKGSFGLRLVVIPIYIYI